MNASSSSSCSCSDIALYSLAAQSYASYGLHVFPCKPRSAVPRVPLVRATNDMREVEQMWSAESSCNVGIRTGAAHWLLVLVVQAGSGLANFRKLQATYGPLNGGLAVRAPNTDLHFYLELPLEWPRVCPPIPNVMLAQGVAVKGEGAYVLAPPSCWPNGERYRVESPGNLPAPVPAWLLRKLRTPAAIASSLSAACVAAYERLEL